MFIVMTVSHQENIKLILCLLLDKARSVKFTTEKRKVTEATAAIAEREPVLNLGVGCKFKFSPILSEFFLILLSSVIVFLTVPRKNSHC